MDNKLCLSREDFLEGVNGMIDKVPYPTRGMISDGYHTFDELYEHRIRLYIALCRTILVARGARVWRSEAHSDGSVWDGWFILGIGFKEKEQITYHLPTKYWDECDFAQTLDKAPDWDGHTSADVLERLKNFKI